MQTWSAAGALLCAGCMFQQTTTTEIRVKEPERVALRERGAGVVLAEHVADAMITATEQRQEKSTATYADHDGPWTPMRASHDGGALRIHWPGRTDTLVSERGEVLGGNDTELAPPDMRAGALEVPVTSAGWFGPCTYVPARSGRSGHAAYKLCWKATWSGELTTPWSNVTRVRKRVVPLDREWASFDLVAAGILGTVAMTFLVPPHRFRSAGVDTAIGIGFSIPALLGLVNGIGILARSPYEEELFPRGVQSVP